MCCNKCHGLITPEKEAIGCQTAASRLTWHMAWGLAFWIEHQSAVCDWQLTTPILTFLSSSGHIGIWNLLFLSQADDVVHLKNHVSSGLFVMHNLRMSQMIDLALNVLNWEVRIHDWWMILCVYIRWQIHDRRHNLQTMSLCSDQL